MPRMASSPNTGSRCLLTTSRAQTAMSWWTYLRFSKSHTRKFIFWNETFLWINKPDTLTSYLLQNIQTISTDWMALAEGKLVCPSLSPHSALLSLGPVPPLGCCLSPPAQPTQSVQPCLFLPASILDSPCCGIRPEKRLNTSHSTSIPAHLWRERMRRFNA